MSLVNQLHYIKTEELQILIQTGAGSHIACRRHLFWHLYVPQGVCRQLMKVHTDGVNAQTHKFDTCAWPECRQCRFGAMHWLLHGCQIFTCSWVCCCICIHFHRLLSHNKRQTQVPKQMPSAHSTGASTPPECDQSERCCHFLACTGTMTAGI